LFIKTDLPTVLSDGSDFQKLLDIGDKQRIVKFNISILAKPAQFLLTQRQVAEKEEGFLFTLDSVNVNGSYETVVEKCSRIFSSGVSENCSTLVIPVCMNLFYILQKM